MVFEFVADRNKILCDFFWSWEEKFSLSLKPWHQAFNPATETFDKVPMWVRLPNLPLHFWFESCLEAFGNSLGEFLMIDEGFSNLLHSTYARMLVEMEVSKSLPEEISIKTSKGCWAQPLDYEGVPFRYRRCFQTSHIVANCAKPR